MQAMAPLDLTFMSYFYTGMIVLPIAGNACEHITAVVVSRQG